MLSCRPRSVTTEESQPLGFPFLTPADPIPVISIPSSTLPAADPHFTNAQRGRYLAGMAGVCIDCHSPESPGPVPARLDSLFAGGRGFGPGTFSSNITPAASGIANMTVAQIIAVLKQGVDEMGNPICPPMPVGPGGAYGGLSDKDAEAIAYYIKTIPPIAHTVPDCMVP